MYPAIPFYTVVVLGGIAIFMLWLWLGGDETPSTSDSSSSSRPLLPLIGNVVQRTGFITVYGEDGGSICNFTCAPGDRIMHFTSTAIHVRKEAGVCVYNSLGQPGRNYT